jgi:hypothetical protein
MCCIERACAGSFQNLGLRPDRRPGTPTYLEALLPYDPKDEPKAEYLESDIRQLIHKPSFGHWLLSSGLHPVPLALILDCSQKSKWDARAWSHKRPSSLKCREFNFCRRRRRREALSFTHHRHSLAD